jgi:hypothetical protein
MSASARDGTGENSSENWTSPEFFSPIFSLGPSRIRRCIVLPEQTKTRIIRTLITNELTYKTGAFRAIPVLKMDFRRLGRIELSARPAAAGQASGGAR